MGAQASWAGLLAWDTHSVIVNSLLWPQPSRLWNGQ